MIILVSSVSYEEGQQGQAAYGSSKAGVVGLVLPMARDLARYGIRVVAIAPSLFDTAMGQSFSRIFANVLTKRFRRRQHFGKVIPSFIRSLQKG